MSCTPAPLWHLEELFFELAVVECKQNVPRETIIAISKLFVHVKILLAIMCLLFFSCEQHQILLLHYNSNSVSSLMTLYL